MARPACRLAGNKNETHQLRIVTHTSLDQRPGSQTVDPEKLVVVPGADSPGQMEHQVDIPNRIGQRVGILDIA